MPIMLNDLSRQLADGLSLRPDQIKAAVESMTAESIAPEVKADFLTALAAKGETVEEIAGFAHELRDRSLQPPLDNRTRGGIILDVVGTGGDKLHTINLSTAAALITASAGVTVAKHGNRAVTSQSGSADVLEALGIPINLTPAEAAASLRDHNFAFFFAPQYHPAFKHIVPARRICAERGQRTIFNFLGPLLNPARPTAQLMGVPRPDMCEPLARVLSSLGIRRGMVVCGSAGDDLWMDELSILGENAVAEFYHQRAVAGSRMRWEELPLQPASLQDLKGGDRQANAETIRRILGGQERGPKLDAVLLNAGAALFVADKAGSVTEGWALAKQLIDQGTALAKLDELRV